MLRILLYGILFYFLYKFVKKLFLPTTKKKTHIRDDSKRDKPRPYDKDNIEDIDYEEL